jgi:predicted small lipoprotein YifL
VRVTRSLLALLASSALLLPLAACGDDGESSLGSTDDPSDVTDDTTEDTTDDTATDDTADDGDDGSGSGGDVGDFCLNDEYSEAMAEASEAIGSLGTGEDADYGALEDFFNAFADEAPDEVADDFRVYADFWGDYAELFADIDFSDPDTFQDPDVLAAFDDLDSEALEEAQANIDAWMTENC